MKYAVFTVSLPDFSPLEAIANVKAWGFDGIEWRVTADAGDTAKPGFWSGNRCTLQADWSDARFREIARATADAGLAVPNLGTYLKCSDAGAIERMMNVAKLFGAPSLRVGAASYDGRTPYSALFDDTVRHCAKVDDLAAQYGLKVVFEIHMHTIIPSASAAHRLVSHFAPARFGVIHDAGNMAYEGYENYQMGCELLGAYLAYVHAKNAAAVARDTAGPQTRLYATQAAPMRAGAVDFAALFRALKQVGYDSWIAIEDFCTEAPLTTRIPDDLCFLKSVAASVQEPGP